MITKDIALSLSYRDELKHKTLKNADGSPMRCRVNGKCQTWKTRPNDFRLPVMHGLYTPFAIEPRNAGDWEKA